MYDPNILSKSIGITRFPMMLLIVLIHCGFSENYAGEPVPPLAHDFIFLFTGIISRVAVPLFFFISGFLFFYNKQVNREFYISACRKRVGTLLVPYILWNTLALLFKMFKCLPAMAAFFPRMKHMDMSICGIIGEYGPFVAGDDMRPLGVYDPVGAPADMPLWFIRDLIALVLMAPLVYRLMKGAGGKVASVVLITLFLLGIWPDKCFWFSLTGVTFFCLGAYFSVNRIDLLKSFSFGGNDAAAFCSFSVVAVAAIVGRIICRDDYWGARCLALYILSALPLFMLVCAQLARREFKIPPLLLSGTFFLYALHGIIASIIAKIVIQVMKPLTALGCISAYLMIAAGLVAVCYLLYWLLLKISPTVASALTGNRTKNSN